MEFSLNAMQKKGMASTKHTIDWIIGGLVSIVLISTLAGTIFTYLGTKSGNLGNTTSNPDVPTWLPTVLIIIVAVGLVYLVLRATGVSK